MLEEHRKVLRRGVELVESELRGQLVRVLVKLPAQPEETLDRFRLLGKEPLVALDEALQVAARLHLTAVRKNRLVRRRYLHEVEPVTHTEIVEVGHRERIGLPRPDQWIAGSKR